MAMCEGPEEAVSMRPEGQKRSGKGSTVVSQESAAHWGKCLSGFHLYTCSQDRIEVRSPRNLPECLTEGHFCVTKSRLYLLS